MMETRRTEPVDGIPAKRYFTIGEVSELCGLKAHVLRYWEQEFPQLSPVKRRGNRRYYQRDDVLLIRVIRHLLYEEGFTINGARQKLDQRPGRGRKPAAVSVTDLPDRAPVAAATPPPAYPDPGLLADEPAPAPTPAGPSPEELADWRKRLEEALEILK